MNHTRAYVVFYGLTILLLFGFSILAFSKTLPPIVSAVSIAFLVMCLVAIRSGQKTYNKSRKGE